MALMLHPVRVVPLPNDPPYFGGGHGTGLIPTHLFYANTGKLPRKASLPHHSKGRETKFKSAEAERYYNQIYDGEFIAKWVEQPENSSLTIMISRENGEPAFCNTFAYHPAADTAQHGMLPTEWAGSAYSKLQHGPMNARALYRFFRSYAVHLPRLWRTLIYTHLADWHNKTKLWAERLDLAIAYADSQFNTRYENMRLALSKVGEALEATGRFVEAAKIYEDAVHADVTHVDEPGECSEFILREFAGLAYKRAGKYEEAEKAYVDALYVDCNVRCRGRRWDVENERTTDLFEKILLAYHAVGAKMGNQLNPGNLQESIPYADMVQMFPCFCVMLHCIGYQPKPGSGLLQAFQESVQSNLQSFQPEIQSSKQLAHEALRAAVNTNSVENFRAALFGCVQGGKDIKVSVRITEGTSFDSGQKTANKRLARSDLGDNDDSVAHAVCCNPACRRLALDQKLFHCPCRDARYCQKDCQRADWKVHKKVCTYHKSKQQQKNKK